MPQDPIIYATYDYGQPEGEKNGMLVRNRDGDKRVLKLGALFLVFFVVTLLVGAILSVSSVQRFLDGRQSNADISLGAESFPITDCRYRWIDLAELHAVRDLSTASSVVVSVTHFSAEGESVARGTAAIELEDIDWSVPPEQYLIPIGRSDLEQLGTAEPSTCSYSVDIAR